MYGSNIRAEARRIGVVGDRDGDFDIIGCGAAFELCFCLDIHIVSIPSPT